MFTRVPLQADVAFRDSLGVQPCVVPARAAADALRSYHVAHVRQRVVVESSESHPLVDATMVQ